MRTSIKLVLGVVATALLASPAAAQNSGNIFATATVLGSISVTGTNLNFGNVAQGQAKVVAPNAAGAGAFTVVGQASTPVVLSFTSLPADVNSANLPLSSWQYMHANVNSTAALSAAGVTVGNTFNGTLNATGNYYVWVGATVTAAAAATPGNYTSVTPITLQVVYQ